MIVNKDSFEKEFSNTFGNLSRESLSAIETKRVRFELGEDFFSNERIDLAIKKSTLILEYYFLTSDIWMRIIIWDKEQKNSLINLLKEYLKDKLNYFFEGVYNGEDILYIYCNVYNPPLIISIASLIINFEQGKEPSANITCYFINFVNAVIANIYDDRGMDVVSFPAGASEGVEK
ncbi:MAG: hypothetical protein LBE82_09835 [Chitinophagaceae bacterium]|jgi:hypothetical protein|nr:hypothetical protein [Chitinophagaceae bacterium]